MKAFGTETPYQINWHGKNRTTIPFIVTDLLPVVALAINGKHINALIDTGGEVIYLDEAVAASLVLSTTHLLIAKGSVNDKDALNLFVDSGLADSEAALALTSCLPSSPMGQILFSVSSR